MKQIKTASYLLFLLFFGITILVGCSNYSSENQAIAEKYAIEKQIAISAWPSSVRETIYDEQSDRYIILLERAVVFLPEQGKEYIVPIEEGEDITPRVAIVGVTDGRASFYSRGDGIGGWVVDSTPEKITVTGPDDQVYEFDLT